MRNNETGEFELVVGNRQLLSGFFIVVLLFAVAFAMGYVVGQNTQRPVRLASDGGPANGAAGNAANTAAADSRPQPASPLTPAPAPSTPPARTRLRDSSRHRRRHPGLRSLPPSLRLIPRPIPRLIPQPSRRKHRSRPPARRPPRRRQPRVSWARPNCRRDRSGRRSR